MADISQITLPTGTTYDVKDSTARDAIKVWYGTCSTAASTAQKDVTISSPTTPAFKLVAGSVLVVKFDNQNTSATPTLKVGSLAAKPIKPGIAYLWLAGAMCIFVYDGSSFNCIPIGVKAATSNVWGFVRLSDSTSSTSSDYAATPKAVSDALTAAKAYADSVAVGGTSFQGVANAGTDISGLSDYSAGYYWVVGTAGTYAGATCEVGDFIFCVSDMSSSYSADDFKVVQANIDTSTFAIRNELGELAFKDTASTSYTPAGTVSQPTFTGTQGSVSVSGTIADSVTLASQASSATGAADVTPAGTVSQPTFAGTAKYLKANTTTVNSITDVGSLPSCTLPSLTTSVSNEVLTIGWSAGSFSAGSLPTKGSDTTVATGITTADSATGAVDVTPAGTVSQPTFSGTANYVKATVGTASKTMTGNFTPSGTVSQPTFSGTAATITSS